MIFHGANATMVDNAIEGSGVAGIRVAGKARIVANKIFGKSMRPTGPPNFAVWALPGSHLMMTSNAIQSWRHGLLAKEASVMAAENTIQDFHHAAIIVQKPTSPANVFNNRAITSNRDDLVLKLDGEAGIVADNTVSLTEASGQKRQ